MLDTYIENLPKKLLAKIMLSCWDITIWKKYVFGDVALIIPRRLYTHFLSRMNELSVQLSPGWVDSEDCSYFKRTHIHMVLLPIWAFSQLIFQVSDWSKNATVYGVLSGCINMCTWKTFSAVCPCLHLLLKGPYHQIRFA
jgi:hypothetical protein